MSGMILTGEKTSIRGGKNTVPVYFVYHKSHTAKGPQKMATNKSPTRQTTIQQNSERTKTPITHSQK